ncbi:MAG: 4Fe-4S dicluster domain-containing protein [Bacteroidetes bacterium]|nr:4Fe-4S dicluster domain-containing protein [Bacteroidota bacterium]
MKQFGYSINPDRQIDYDLTDKSLLSFIVSFEPSLLSCISCGTCTATCTAGHFTDFNIRRVHTLLRRGEITTLKKEIQKCMLCGKCQLACPAGVNLRNLIRSIHVAVEKFNV